MAASKGPLQVDNNTWYVAPAVKVALQKEVGTDVLPASTGTLPVDKVNTLMFTACVEDDDAEPDADELVHIVFQQEESVVAGDMERSVTDCGVEKVTWADGQALALKVLNHESSGHAYTVKGHNMRNEWLFDTGSTLHICNDLKWFVPGTLAPVGAKSGSITTGGGVVRFLLRGTVAVQLLRRDGTFADIRLTNVALGIGQQRWMVVMLDEYSGRIYAGSFSYKGDCNRCITDQLKWYRNQTGGQLKRITVENGTDVNIQELTAFVHLVGADIRTSPTYSLA
ncbi:hypothetical protein CFIMG_008406RA00001 [Ceratocystis fimbriata CBS 114723]|uniref:Uncharacterized protein n=1 Tax=Ceratocystis fimbriata CBS 114723 TaxID=1035309 RepID=A0A2C5X3Q5_9PEZI|nr:hypothetical protein CFIMG_008406RA00001 [Ceratocystis fimbriata CBS 114723]